MKSIVYGILLAVVTFLIGAAVVLGPAILAANIPLDRDPAYTPVEPVNEVTLASTANDVADVYRAVLFGDRGDRKLVLQGDSESGLRFVNSLVESRRTDGIERATIADFLKNNSRPADLVSLKGLGPNVVLFSEKDYERIFKSGGDGWEKFRTEYPGVMSIISVSNIGFNADHTQALVYTSDLCGPLCGSGEITLLKRSGKTWKVANTINAWIS